MSEVERLLTMLHGKWERKNGYWPAVDAMEEAAQVIESLQAQLVEAQRRLEWLDNNTMFYDVDADFEVEGRNIPSLAQVSQRIWYHATDDQSSYPFSTVIDAALHVQKTQKAA